MYCFKDQVVVTVICTVRLQNHETTCAATVCLFIYLFIYPLVLGEGINIRADHLYYCLNAISLLKCSFFLPFFFLLNPS